MDRNHEKELWVKVYLESLKSGKTAKQSKDLADSSFNYFLDCFKEPTINPESSPSIHFSKNGLCAYIPFDGQVYKYDVPEPFSYDFSRWVFSG